MEKILSNSFIDLALGLSRAKVNGDAETLLASLISLAIAPIEAKKISSELLRQKSSSVPSTETLQAAWDELSNLMIKRDQGQSVKRSKPTLFTALGLQNSWPKNLVYWYIMRYVLGADVFDFFVPDTSRHEKGKNIINFPFRLSDRHGYLPFSLAACGLGGGVNGIPSHILKKADHLFSSLGREVATRVVKVFVEADVIFPPKTILTNLVETIKRGLAGERILLTGVFCPDYGYEETGNVFCPYRYTFSGLDDGVGLVAQQVVRLLPSITACLDDLGISYDIKLAIADFEANSEIILRKVGVDRQSFRKSCLGSLQSFQNTLPNLQMDLVLFEEQWANGRWQKTLQQAKNLFRDDNFGSIVELTGKKASHEINYIAEDNHQFYNRWYDHEHSLLEIEDLVKDQAAEYAAIGKIVSQDYQDRPIIFLAGDRPKMQIFYYLFPTKSFSVLCGKRLY